MLIYELLDEVMDFGYGQITTTETLKNYVMNEPLSVDGESGKEKGFSKMTTQEGEKKQRKSAPSSAPNKPMSLGLGRTGKNKNEIFVDLLERLTVLFNANGQVLRSEIDGCIQMKSFLQGTPDLSVGLNEDITIGKSGRYGIQLDDCTFHECVDSSGFDTHKVTLQGAVLGPCSPACKFVKRPVPDSGLKREANFWAGTYFEAARWRVRTYELSYFR